MRRAALPDVILVGTALLAAGCHGLSDDRAVRLVQAYNDRVVEAFRLADARLVEGVAGPREAKKLTALIGVKNDQGITLDAQLQGLTVIGVAREGGTIKVATDERWHYVDRAIGSGAQVGQSSDDHYTMLYLLGRDGDRWVVQGVKFLGPPQVGRSSVPNRGSTAVLHGLAPTPPATQEAHP